MIKIIVENKAKTENINASEKKLLVHELCSMSYSEVLRIYNKGDKP